MWFTTKLVSSLETGHNVNLKGLSSEPYIMTNGDMIEYTEKIKIYE